jgi:hypothetical protein
MNKTTLAIAGGILVLIVGYFFLQSQQTQRTPQIPIETEEAMMEKETMEENGNMMEEKMENGDQMMKPTSQSGYVDYSKQAYNSAEGKKRVLYFHADWCPICRPLDRAFQSRMGEIPQDVVVFKTNYDTETALKNQYAVTYQHTFVQVDGNGKAIKVWSGGQFDEVLGNII